MLSIEYSLIVRVQLQLYLRWIHPFCYGVSVNVAQFDAFVLLVLGHFLNAFSKRLKYKIRVQHLNQQQTWALLPISKNHIILLLLPMTSNKVFAIYRD